MRQLPLLFLLLLISFSLQAQQDHYLNSKDSRSDYSTSQLPAPEIQQSSQRYTLKWHNLNVYLTAYPNQTQDDYSFGSSNQPDPQKEAEEQILQLIQQQGIYPQLQQLNQQQSYPLPESQLKRLYRRLKGELPAPRIIRSQTGSEGFLFAAVPTLSVDIEWTIPQQKVLIPLQQAIANSEVVQQRRAEAEQQRKEQLAQQEKQRQAKLEKRLKALEEMDEIIVGDNKSAIDQAAVTALLAKSSPQWAARLGLVKQIPGQPTGFKMVSLGKAGQQQCYWMGSPSNEKGRDDDERQHRVCIDSFRIASHEVSNAMYRQYQSSHNSKEYKGHSLNGAQQPVVEVSWNEANDYIDWLNRTMKPAKPYRLPTEAEWEYAARGGESSRYYWGEDRSETLACDYANVNTAKSKRTFDWFWDGFNCENNHLVNAPVGSYRPNNYGLYDILGNVGEWTASDYDKSYSGGELRSSTQGRDSKRVIRGGSWFNSPRSARVSYRKWYGTLYRYNNLGFRLAQDLTVIRGIDDPSMADQLSNSRVLQTYRDKMRLKLNDLTIYPQIIAEKHLIEEGRVVVRFILNRAGELLETEIIESSNHVELDDAVKQMIQLAQPFEPLPDELKNDKVAFAFPVTLKLQNR